MAECCLCSQIEGQPANDLIARLLPDQPYRRRVMLENRSFAVVPSLGPLVRGHSLVCPRVHVRSFAQLDVGVSEDLRAIQDDLATRLRALYGNAVHLFEHGTAEMGDRVLCTVDHAHLHVLPLDRACAIDGHAWITFDGSLASLKRLAGGREYILYVTPDGVSRLLLAHEEIESQLMRKIVASALGQPDRWDWRAAPDAAAADAAWRDFSSVGAAS